MHITVMCPWVSLTYQGGVENLKKVWSEPPGLRPCLRIIIVCLNGSLVNTSRWENYMPNIHLAHTVCTDQYYA